MTQVNIIGAGLAGLLAGNMLRHRATILEKQPSLPNNHRALLRFRTGVFGTALGISFKKVKMIKAVYGDNSNPIRNELNYSRKVTGELRSDRSLPIGVVKEDRFIAPNDLVGQMASVCDIKYGIDDWMKSISPYYGKDLQSKFSYEQYPSISTIPMPALMELLEYPGRNEVEFRSLKGSVITADIKDCDAYVTYYFADPQFPIYRASITGSKFIIEALDQDILFDESFSKDTCIYYGRIFGVAPNEFSNFQYHQMKYAKILPIDEDIRKDFMHWATVNFNIYSLGRFATWRPGLLLDDLVNDVSLISRWIMKGGKYNAAKHWS